MLHRAKKTSIRLVKKHRNLILYGFIGISGAILDLLFYYILFKFLNIPPAIASFLSISIGIINNYILNCKFNFKVKNNLLLRFVSFYTIGVGGAILSTILITILFNGLGVDAISSKLITIVPVVVLQYFLNKHFSFKESNNYLTKESINLFLKKYKLIIIINIVFIISTIAFVRTIPLSAPSGAPDESTHYQYNVKFMLENKRLPISGKDDLSALKSCHDNNLGEVPCMYSYQTYPGANYIVSAIIAWFSHNIFGISLIKGARLASVLFGLIFVNLIYITSIRLLKKDNIAAAITALISLIPQVIFTCSYVNQDAHSLAIGAFVIYCLVRLIQNPNKHSLILSAIAFGGLLPLAKYNYYVLAPAIIVAIIIAYLYKKINFNFMMKLTFASIVAFIAIASFWFIRNYILYHDILGQSFIIQEMSKYHALGTPHSILSTATIKLFSSLFFFVSLFNSFFAGFGYMMYFFTADVYSNIKLILLGCLFASFALCIYTKKTLRTKLILSLLWFIFILITSIFLVYYNSAIYDFQPQGRYLFPVLAPLALVLSYSVSINKHFKYIVICILFLSMYMYLYGIDLFIRSYL